MWDKWVFLARSGALYVILHHIWSVTLQLWTDLHNSCNLLDWTNVPRRPCYNEKWEIHLHILAANHNSWESYAFCILSDFLCVTRIDLQAFLLEPEVDVRPEADWIAPSEIYDILHILQKEIQYFQTNTFFMNDNFVAAPLPQVRQGHLWLLQQQEEHTHR